jgi:hypothetical protein
MCYVEAKHSSSDPVSNVIYGSNPKVNNAKSRALTCITIRTYKCKNLYFLEYVQL